jgi:uncharacterized membrane protein
LLTRRTRIRAANKPHSNHSQQRGGSAMHGDPLWMKVLLVVHIAAGFGSFLLAPVALVTAKGGRAHKRWGMVYFWCMAGVAATALPMALFRPVLFLALVSVLSFYLVFSGYRVLRLKDLARGGSAGAIYWIAAVLVFGVCATLAGLGWLHPHAVQGVGIVAIVLGLVGMRGTAMDMYVFWAKPKEKMFWWYSHLAKFIGSYIAAWTAFSVVTLPHIFPQAGVVLWLWPVTLGVPAIIATTAYYKRKFNRRPPAPALQPAVL